MTSLTLANDLRSIRRGVGSSECEKEAADDGTSEPRLVDGADTLKRAISEPMRVIRLPSSLWRHNCSFVE